MIKPATLSDCDREPIHLLGTIQPIGFLVAIASDWTVVRVSSNVALYAGRSPDELLGQPIAALFDPGALHTLRNRVMQLTGADAVERAFGMALLRHDRHTIFDCAIHRSGDLIVIEAEPCDPIQHIETTGLMRFMVGHLDAVSELGPFLRQGARQVHILTGFDRVMVYKFLDDGTGEVVAEVVRPGVEPLMGLRYPASDIPVQARAMYLRAPFRIICDVDAVPAAILPMTQEAVSPLDLSLSILRAVSPVHLMYLRNMGVSASLSISIIVEGRLWGMFACHHFTPRRPGFELRTLTELFVQMFAMRLERHERSAAAQVLASARATGDRLMAAVADDVALLDDPDWLMTTIGGILPGDGLAISLKGRVVSSGMVLDDDMMVAVSDHIASEANDGVFATDRLVDILPQLSGRQDMPSGLLAIPISATSGDRVMVFRRQRIRSVVWAGNPHKPADSLSPRTSFAAWREEVRDRSEPFTASEIGMAETLRVSFVDIVLRLANAALAERQRGALRQEVLIAELNHRVRNILALIGGLIHASRDTNASISDYTEMFEGRIQALARAHDHITLDNWGPAPLDDLFQAEAGDHIAAGRVLVSGKPTMLEPLAYSTMTLVIHELLTNAVKHGALSSDGSIDITWAVDDDGSLALVWCEHGDSETSGSTRRGLGSIIIEQLIPHDLGGTVTVDHRGTGLHATLRVPARFVRTVEPKASQAASIPTDRPADAFATTSMPLCETILVVEDNLLVAIHLEDMLKHLGVGHVAMAGTVATAIDEIERTNPDFAILDINLGIENSFPVADRLRHRGIGYIFASGYGDRAILPDIHADTPIIQKPYTAQAITAAIRHRLSPPESPARR